MKKKFNPHIYRVRSINDSHHEVVRVWTGEVIEIHDNLKDAQLHVQDLSGWIYEKPYDFLQISKDEENYIKRKKERK